MLAVLFVIEVVINGSFLSKSNEEGLLGGALQAVSFAALNIIASFLFGLVPIRLINRRNPLFKLMGFLSLLIYLAFAAILNLTLAHLREMPPTITGEIGQQVLAQLSQHPFVLNDVNSWVFFGIGFIFSLVAMTDGLLFTDPYFGYGALERRCIEARNHYTDGKAELIDRLRDIRDTASEAMNGAARDLSVRRSEYDAILQARTRLAQRFSEHQNQIERSARALLSIYREANLTARTTPAPNYFSRPYELARIIYAVNEPSEAMRERLARSTAQKPRFATHRYEMAVAVARSSTRIERDCQQVLQWARQFIDAGTFAAHIERAGFASNGMRDFVGAFGHHLAAADAPSDDETVWRLLRRFQILPFDFESPGSDYDHRAREQARSVLARKKLGRAADLWSVLSDEAWRATPQAAKWTGLARSRTRANPQVSAGRRPDLRPAHARLSEASDDALADIKDDIGGARLSRGN